MTNHQFSTASNDELLFANLLDQLASSGSAVTHVEPGTELASFAIDLHRAANATAVPPSLSDQLLHRLLAEQEKTIMADTASTAFTGTIPIAPPTRLAPPVSRPQSTPWGWAALLTLFVISSILIGQFIIRQPSDDSPILMAPTTAASPTAIAQPTPAAGLSLVWQSSDGQGAMTPTWVGIAPDETIWVVDAPKNNIRIYSLDGELLRVWGTAGSGDGQFNFNVELNNPTNMSGTLAWDSEDNLYVTDPGNARIQKFDRDLNFVLAFGSRGSGLGQFGEPMGIRITPDDIVYVTDNSLDRVQSFTTDGTALGTFGKRGTAPDQIRNVVLGHIDPDGNIWVMDWYSHRIRVFSPQGDLLFGFGGGGDGPGYFSDPTDVVFDDQGYAYVSDYVSSSIMVFDRTGHFVAQYEILGLGDNPVNPISIDYATDGTLYVADAGNGVLLRLNLTAPSGIKAQDEIPEHYVGASATVSFVWQSSSGSAASTMGSPGSVTVAPDGTVWVPDATNGIVHIFDAEGRYIEDWGEQGSGPGQLAFAPDVTGDNRLALVNQVLFLDDGSYFVSDPGNARIQRFNADRSYLGEFGSSGPESTVGGIGPMFNLGNGEIGVLDTSLPHASQFELVVVDQTGTFLRRATYQGGYPVAFLPDGRYWAHTGAETSESVALFATDGTVIAYLRTVDGGVVPFEVMATGQVDADGNLFISSSVGPEVAIYSPEGVFITRWDGSDSDRGVFDLPYWVALDGTGGVYVADYRGFNIAKYQVTLTTNSATPTP